MSDAKKHIEVRQVRVIPAPAGEVFDAWLDASVPGTPWNIAEKLLLNPQVDGFFYWLYRGNAHYGRFTEIERPGRLVYAWMSRSTLGEETTVTVTFEPEPVGTRMTLVHAGIPDTEGGRGHQNGWAFFLDSFEGTFQQRASPK